MEKIFIGIDIGKDGAIKVLDPKDNFTCVMPLDSEGALDIDILKTILSTYRLESLRSPNEYHVIFEKLTPLHLASKSSNWSLAHQYGAIEACCISLSLPYTKVPPKEWQAMMFSNIAPLRKKDGTSDTKGRALLKVQELFPSMKLTDPNKPKSKVPHNGIVDAILLAEYGRRKIK